MDDKLIEIVLGSKEVYNPLLKVSESKLQKQDATLLLYKGRIYKFSFSSGFNWFYSEVGSPVDLTNLLNI